MPTPEEMAEIQKERILSDAELIKGGADVTPEGGITATEDQIKDAKIEMGVHFYNKSKDLEGEIRRQRRRVEELSGRLKMRVEINGIQLNLEYAEYSDPEQYILSFPQLSGDAEFNEGEIRMPMGWLTYNDKKKEETARKLFEYASSVAQAEKDVKNVFKQVKEYRDELIV